MHRGKKPCLFFCVRVSCGARVRGEMADTQRSGRCESNLVGVQVSPYPQIKRLIGVLFWSTRGLESRKKYAGSIFMRRGREHLAECEYLEHYV